MDIVMLIGGVAATLTTAAFVPQVIKAHQTKETKDLSLLMYVLTAGGLALWLIYGFFLSSLPIILANLLTLILCSYILYLKIKHG
jgi:MtN3 and saliva related transmembrane protein